MATTTLAESTLHVVNDLVEIVEARDGDKAIVVAPSAHRESSFIIERYVRLAGRWVDE